GCLLDFAIARFRDFAIDNIKITKSRNQEITKSDARLHVLTSRLHTSAETYRTLPCGLPSKSNNSCLCIPIWESYSYLHPYRIPRITDAGPWKLVSQHRLDSNWDRSSLSPDIPFGRRWFRLSHGRNIAQPRAVPNRYPTKAHQRWRYCRYRQTLLRASTECRDNPSPSACKRNDAWWPLFQKANRYSRAGMLRYKPTWLHRQFSPTCESNPALPGWDFAEPIEQGSR